MLDQSRISAFGALLAALQDRTRGLIFSEFLFADELTASMVSERLGITFTNASYHLRRLLAAGIIEPSREVAAGFRTEKFYRITRELQQALLARPDAITETYDDMTAQERQTAHCAWLAIAGNMLLRGADRYQRMQAEEFERLFSDEKLMMLAMGRVAREPLKQLLRIARAALPENWGEIGASDPSEHPDHVVFAVLPELLLT